MRNAEVEVESMGESSAANSAFGIPHSAFASVRFRHLVERPTELVRRVVLFAGEQPHDRLVESAFVVRSNCISRSWLVGQHAHHVGDVDHAYGPPLPVDDRQFAEFAFGQNLDGRRHALAGADGRRRLGHHVADGLIERRVAAPLDQPRQVAVGEQPGQPAGVVHQHDRAAAAARPWY